MLTNSQENSLGEWETVLSPQDDRALRRLAAAMVKEAIDDMRRGRSGGDYLGAWRWVNGYSEDGLTFDMCAGLLGYRTDDLRERIERRCKLRRASTTPRARRELRAAASVSRPTAVVAAS